MARPIELPTPKKRDGFWHLIRRVPKAYAAVDGRKLVVVSLGIRIADDPRGIAAQKVLDAKFAELNRLWEDKRAGRVPVTTEKLDQAIEVARSFNLPYLPADEIALKGVEEAVRRIEMVLAPKLLADERGVRGVLGGVPRTAVVGIKLSGMLDEVERINATEFKEMSPNQLKKWRDIRKDQVKHLVEVIGNDIDVSGISREHGQAFRDFLQNRVLEDEITSGTANSYLFRLTGMYTVIKKFHRFKVPEHPFQDLAFKKEEAEQRQAFPLDHVQNRILQDGMFDDLNPEARGVVYLMAETGLRLSEACNLQPFMIHLDDKIPYVEVMPFERKLKTTESMRQIPLVGCALMAMQANPQGFPRYLDKSASLSGLLGKAFKARGLFLTEKQKVYSLRHT